MEPSIAGLILPAFGAGLLTFLAPCTLPLVPAYLGFISGLPGEELNDPALAHRSRRVVFFNGLFFVFGFSIVFIVLGVIAGFAGAALAPYRLWLTRVGGVLVILFGLFLLGLFRLPWLYGEKRFHVPRSLRPGRPLTSLAIGLSFGFGWTPCVGPILGSILLLASTTTTALPGGILLAVFSLGLAVPFLIIALGIGSAMKSLKKLGPYLRVVSVIGGAFLVGLGLLLAFNRISLLISWGYKTLAVIGYDRLINKL